MWIKMIWKEYTVYIPYDNPINFDVTKDFYVK